MKNISLFTDNGTCLTKVHPFTKIAYIAAAVSIPLIVGRLGKSFKENVSADCIFFYNPYYHISDPWAL